MPCYLCVHRSRGGRRALAIVVFLWTYLWHILCHRCDPLFWLRLLLIIFLPGCQDNWSKRGLVFWTSVSGHQGLLYVAEIEQKGMFDLRFHVPWVASSGNTGANMVSLLLSGSEVSSCLSTHLMYCKISELVLLSFSPHPPLQGTGDVVSGLLLLHLVLFVTQAGLLPFLVTHWCGAGVSSLVGEKPRK